MAAPTRLLYISGEVAPFAAQSDVADLVRLLPEQLQDSGDYELRILMPRYGTISERRNRLHEVIRLSGTDIQMGEDQHTLKVKVASIPGIRLQVYFMDNAHYFKRKGIYGTSKSTFDDNPERALFFGRAALATIQKLGWKPELVHAFGWMSALVPMLLKKEFGEGTIFEEAKAVFTPNGVDLDDTLTAEQVEAFGLPDDTAARPFTEIGPAYADAVFAPTVLPAAAGDGSPSLDDVEPAVAEVRALYDQLRSEVPA